MRCAIHGLKSRACLKISDLSETPSRVRWLNIPSAGQICELGRLHDPGRRHGSPPRRVLPGGLLRGAAALADPERADGAGCAAHGGARHEAPGLLPEGLAVRGRPAKAVRVQVGRCHDEPTLDRAVSSHWLPASVALRISHGRTAAAFVPAGGPPSPPPPPFSAPAPSLSAHASSAQWQAGAQAQPAFPTFTRTTNTRAPKNPRASHVPCFRSLAPRVHESSALTLAGWCAQVEQEHLRADHRRQQGRRPLLRLHQGEGHGRRHRQRCTIRPHHTPLPYTLEHEPYPEP